MTLKSGNDFLYVVTGTVISISISVLIMSIRGDLHLMEELGGHFLETQCIRLNVAGYHLCIGVSTIIHLQAYLKFGLLFLMDI
jgi:hypothetical protein